ncbi:MAG: hypothetical protein GX790_02450 [Syntrophomonadaceae bacterium]|nr:hypothetical protein [Syntrophomonadaceae bacterium]
MLSKYYFKPLLIILTLGLMLSLVNNAEANDTRNRVLEQPNTITYRITWDAELDPWDSKATKDVKFLSATNSNNTNLIFNIKAYKNGFEITNTVSFADFYPMVDESRLSSGYFNLFVPDNLARSTWMGESDLKGIIPKYNLIYAGGKAFVKSIDFNGFCNRASYPYWDTERVIWNVVPNSKYEFYLGSYVGNMGASSLDAGKNYTYIFSAFYRQSNGKIIGHAYKEDNYNYYSSLLRPTNKITFYTPADDPSIVITNITTDTATISWNTNNTNPEGTSYTLQYQKLKENGDPKVEADWYPWAIIPIDGENTTTKLTTTASVFESDNTYRLRVQVNHIGGPQYNVYSDYVIFSTSADPAVRAAQEAAIAAQAAKKAAEDSVQYSLDAKTSADFVKSEIEHPEYGLQALASQIKNATPFIQRISHPREATITFGNSFDLVINATGTPAYMRYRVICEDFDSGWVPEDNITITGLHQEGLKKALVMVSNNPNNPEDGVIAKDEFKFFKASF